MALLLADDGSTGIQIHSIPVAGRKLCPRGFARNYGVNRLAGALDNRGNRLVEKLAVLIFKHLTYVRCLFIYFRGKNKVIL
jgi:hypothetical protein